MPAQKPANIETDNGRPVIEGGELRQAVLEGERFNCFDFEEATFEDVVFIRCDLRGSHFASCSFSHVFMYQCWTHDASFPIDGPPILIECEERLSPPPSEEDSSSLD